MQTHHASTTRSPNPTGRADPAAANVSQSLSGYNASTAQHKRTVAELVDDQDTLAEWHRNMDRLRADLEA